jgi:hypothetical protein
LFVLRLRHIAPLMQPILIICYLLFAICYLPQPSNPTRALCGEG